MSDNAATDGGRWRSVSSDGAGKGERWRRGSGRVQLVARLLAVEEKRRSQTTTVLSSGGGRIATDLPDGTPAAVAVDERRADGVAGGGRGASHRCACAPALKSWLSPRLQYPVRPTLYPTNIQGDL